MTASRVRRGKGEVRVGGWKLGKAPAWEGGRYKVIGERDGARKRTRTSTTVRPLAPEASASASSAIRAQGKQQAGLILGSEMVFVNERGRRPLSYFVVRRKLPGVAIVVLIGTGGFSQSGGADRDSVLRHGRNGSLLSGLGSGGSRRIALKLDGTTLDGLNGHSSPPDPYRRKAKGL
jgi:hypothetical protein